MNERTALEEKMKLKKERSLGEEQMRHVQEEHKISMKAEEQRRCEEERCKRMDEQNQLLNEEQEKSDEDMEIPRAIEKNIPKDIPWETLAEDSFITLKEELVKVPTLHTPDLSHPFLLFTDASATANGACLAQHNDHMEEMSIASLSKKLTLVQVK
ncbi:retrovirus-related Pol polyprotein from transposon 297 [Trichonephila clavipes]|nr:retrovirus-related Pol polyprotein from transposon 297 [Trichonephila clavipes]